METYETVIDDIKELIESPSDDLDRRYKARLEIKKETGLEPFERDWFRKVQEQQPDLWIEVEDKPIPFRVSADCRRLLVSAVDLELAGYPAEAIYRRRDRFFEDGNSYERFQQLPMADGDHYGNLVYSYNGPLYGEEEYVVRHKGRWYLFAGENDELLGSFETILDFLKMYE